MAETKLILNTFKILPESYKFKENTLWGKFQGAFLFFFGDRSTQESLDGRGLKQEYKLGISGWILLIPFSPLLLLMPLLAPLAAILSPMMPALATLSMGVYFVLNAIITAALMMVAAPFIVVAHAIWGPPDPKGITSVRRSFWLNPLTYVMAAILVVGISLLIQGLNLSVFSNLAAPLMIVQTVLMSMAALAVVAGILYAGYRIGLAIFQKPEKKSIHLKSKLIDDQVSLEEPSFRDETSVQEADTNHITKYLSEHLEWAKVNWGKAIFFYGLMLVGVGVVTLLVANYFTAGLLFGSGTEGFMKLVFDFMVSGFASALKSMAGLPGLDVLAASDATLMLIGQILTVFTLITAAIVIPYTGARLCQTGQEEFPSSPEQDINDIKSNYAQLLRERPKPVTKSPSILKNLYKVRALYDLIEAQSGDLSIFTGEELTVLDDQDDTWWTARNANGKVGQIPKTYVERIATPTEPSKFKETFSADSDTESESDKQVDGLYKVKVLHEFVATDAGELTIKSNEILTILDDQTDPFWLKGRNAQGETGIFPSNYVEKIVTPTQTL